MAALQLILAALITFQDPFGVVSGEIHNQDGTVAVGVLVAAMRHPDPRNPRDTALIRLTETDSRGRYTLDRIPPGRYDIVAGPRYAPTYYPGTPLASRSSTLTVVSGARLNSMNFRMKELRIAGRVAEAGTHLPAVGAWVTLRGGEPQGVVREALVKADGSFEFLSLAPGQYELEARYDEFLPRRQTLQLEDESHDDVRLDFGVGRFRGRLVTRDGSPLHGLTSPGAIALSQGADGETLRSVVPIRNDGAFDVRVDSGEYRVSLHSLLNDYSVREIRRGEADLLRQPLRLEAGADIEVRIVLEGRPQSGEVPVGGTVRNAADNGPSTAEKVTLCCAPGPVRRLSAVILDDGSFHFRGVPPGTYTAGMEGATDFWPVVQLVNVGDKPIEDVRLISDPYVLSISGKIEAENGGNLSSARMSLEFRGREDITVPTERGGVFSATLPEAEYRPCVFSSRNDYYVKSIMAGSRNLLREPLKIDGHAHPPIAITLAFRSPEPEGVTVNGRTTLAGAASIVLEMQTETVKAAVEPAGDFSLSHVLPGCYTVSILGSATPPAVFRAFVGDEDIEDLVLEPLP